MRSLIFNNILILVLLITTVSCDNISYFSKPEIKSIQLAEAVLEQEMEIMEKEKTTNLELFNEIFYDRCQRPGESQIQNSVYKIIALSDTILSNLQKVNINESENVEIETKLKWYEDELQKNFPFNYKFFSNPGQNKLYNDDVDLKDLTFSSLYLNNSDKHAFNLRKKYIEFTIYLIQKEALSHCFSSVGTSECFFAPIFPVFIPKSKIVEYGELLNGELFLATSENYNPTVVMEGKEFSNGPICNVEFQPDSIVFDTTGLCKKVWTAAVIAKKRSRDTTFHITREYWVRKKCN